MTMQIAVTVEIIANTCPVCGVHYGMDGAVYDRCARDGNAWYCTNGHRLVITEPEVERLRKELASAQGNLNFYREYSDRKATEARELANQVRAQKSAKTRLMRRVSNGVCPCCNRSFADLNRHMQSKHPSEIVSGAQSVELADPQRSP